MSDMTQDSTPVLDAIRKIRQEGTYTFSLPGHRFGRGIDDRTADVLGREPFQADVIMAKSAVPDAEKLYAQAVGAREAIFTTCGSSISIHTAILSIAGPGSTVLVDRNVHKSVVASLILAGANRSGSGPRGTRRARSPIPPRLGLSRTPWTSIPRSPRSSSSRRPSTARARMWAEWRTCAMSAGCR